MGDTFLQTHRPMILDPAPPLVHPPEFERAKAYIPAAVLDFLEPVVFSGERVGHADPVLLPTDATVATSRAMCSG